jgi:repressor LexA
MERAADYLARLQDFYARHHVLPGSYSELGKLWDIKAKSWVSTLVERLKDERYLASLPGGKFKPGPRFFERPLAESVRAGLPSEAGDAHEALTIDHFLIDHPSRTVLVRVKGDSMVEAGIHDGDIAVVEKRPSANAGEIVVAVVEGEFTLKYLARDRSGYFLKAANPAYAPLRATGTLEIFGVLRGLIRKYRST